MSSHAELTVYLKHASSTHPLPFGGELLVGRSSRAHIRVDDPSVSREHLLLHVGSRIEVEDLGSANGTQIFPKKTTGAVRLAETGPLRPGQRVVLEPGSVLRIGAVPCLLHVEEATGRIIHSTLPPSSGNGAVIVDPEMRRIYELAARAAQSDIGVLIFGETGSGKELLAEAVHNASHRAKKQLLKVNCGAISESLLESELFGHERGAFTGAHTARAGLFENTAGGTIFMDEIGEMPLATQVKLLRVLEEKSIRRVGASKSIPIDVRFVAATNRDLELEVARGRFRRDLYYRISGIVLRLPPLRQRKSEIEPLARHFLASFCMASRIRIPEMTQEAIAALLEYPWPGNVRELRNAMERAPFLSAGGPIGPEHVPRSGGASAEEEDLFPEEEKTDVGPMSAALREVFRPVMAERRMAPEDDTALIAAPRESGARGARGDSERYRVLSALEQARGNQTKAAALLGVSRRTLINRLESFGLPRPRKRVHPDRGQ